MPSRVLVTLITIYAIVSFMFVTFMSAPAVAPCMGLGDNAACVAQWQASRSPLDSVLGSALPAIGLFAVLTGFTVGLRRPPPHSYVGPRPRLPRFRMPLWGWIPSTIGYAILALAVYVFGSSQVAPCLGGQLGDPQQLCAARYFEQLLPKLLGTPLPALAVFLLLLFVTARVTRRADR